MNKQIKRGRSEIKNTLPVDVDKLLNWLNNKIYIISLYGICECAVTVFTKFLRINCAEGYKFETELTEEQREILTLLLLAKPEGLEHYNIQKYKHFDEFTLVFKWKTNPEYVLRKRLKKMLDDPNTCLDDIHDTLLDYLK